MNVEEKAEAYDRLLDAALSLSDGARYKLLRMEADHTVDCPLEDCRLSAYEHHLLAYGILAENRDLKRRLEAFEHGPAEDAEVVEIPIAEYELAQRILRAVKED